MNKEQLENKIRNILMSKNTVPTMENIDNACYETIIELADRNNKTSSLLDSITALLGIVQKEKTFKLTGISLKALSSIIPMYPSVVCGLLKGYYTGEPIAISSYNEKSLEAQLFKLLISNSASIAVSNLIAKSYDINGFFNLCDEEQQCNLLSNSMNVFGNFVDVIAFIGKLHSVKSNNSSTNKKTQNDVILSYLKFKSTLSSSEIKEIQQFIEPETSLNYQILFLIFELNRKNIAKAKVNKGLTVESIFTNKIVELTRYEVIEGTEDENAVIELISLIFDQLLPNFINLIKEINEKFIAENKYQKLLRNCISYIKIEEFAAIVGVIDLSRHCIVFKGLSNIDISVFIEMYCFAIKGITFESSEELNKFCHGLNDLVPDQLNCTVGSPGKDAVDLVLSCLPSFSYYCTDYYNNIENLIAIYKIHFRTHKTVVSTAIERIIKSHTTNLDSCITINNPIPKEDSERILTSLKCSGLVHDLINSFAETNNADIQIALELMIKLTGLDYGEQTISTLMHDSNDIVICNALRLMPFFILNRRFNYDFISRILELTTSPQIDIQKKAYNLLTAIYSCRSSDVCICDLIYSKKAHSDASLKNRLNLQFNILKSGCYNCKVDNKEDLYNRFILELFKNLKTGNSKCKKFISEILINFLDDENFRKFLLLNISKKCTDISLLCGVVECVLVVLNYFYKNMEYAEKSKNTVKLQNYDSADNEPKNLPLDQQNRNDRDKLFLDQLFLGILDICMFSKEIVKTVLKIFPFFVENFYDKIFIVIDSYIHQFSKNYNKELKEFCIEVKNRDYPLTKAMKTLLKFRNIGGRQKDIAVMKKTDFNKSI